MILKRPITKFSTRSAPRKNPFSKERKKQQEALRTQAAVVDWWHRVTREEVEIPTESYVAGKDYLEEGAQTTFSMQVLHNEYALSNRHAPIAYHSFSRVMRVFCKVKAHRATKYKMRTVHGEVYSIGTRMTYFLKGYLDTPSRVWYDQDTDDESLS